MAAPFAGLPPIIPDARDPFSAPSPLDAELTLDEINAELREDAELPEPGEEADRLGMSDEEIVLMVLDFYDEAREAKEAAPTEGRLSRTDEWDANVRAYWAEYDTSQKAPWQAAEKISAPYTFVERFVAFIQQAIIQPGGWFTVEDPTEPNQQLMDYVQKFVRVLLDRSGQNRFGQTVGFDYTVTEVMHQGALKYICLKVIIDDDGRVRVIPVDPDELFLDPTGRGLYRIHDYEVDQTTLASMEEAEHEDGEPVFDREAIKRMREMNGSTREQRLQQRKSEQAGSPTEARKTLRRKPGGLKDYYGYLMTQDGKVSDEKVYIVVGNERELLRGPEKNPFWHAQDWYIGSPVIEVPGSVWGRTYLEPIRPVWETFIDATNALLDGFNAAVLNAYGLRTDALQDPEQIRDGVHPGKTFNIDDTWPPGVPWLEAVPLGGLPPQVFDVWQALDLKMQEMGFLSDLQLGKGVKADTTATEVDATVQSASVFNASVSNNIETQVLSPMLLQVFSCGLQALDPESDPELAAELGEDLTGMLVAQRAEFRDRKFQWSAKGISGLVERGRRVRSSMGFLNILGGSEKLQAWFEQKYSTNTFMTGMMRDMGLNPSDYEITEEERAQQKAQEMMARMQAQQAQIAAGGGPTAPGATGGPPGADASGGAALAGGTDMDGPVSVDPLASFQGGNDIG